MTTDQDDSEVQTRKRFRNDFGISPSGVTKKRSLVTRYRVEDHIIYVASSQSYLVNIQRKFLKVSRPGFKSLESARQFRDEKLSTNSKKAYQ